MGRAHYGGVCTGLVSQVSQQGGEWGLQWGVARVGGGQWGQSAGECEQVQHYSWQPHHLFYRRYPVVSCRSNSSLFVCYRQFPQNMGHSDTVQEHVESGGRTWQLRCECDLVESTGRTFHCEWWGRRTVESVGSQTAVRVRVVVVCRAQWPSITSTLAPSPLSSGTPPSPPSSQPPPRTTPYPYGTSL